jgi:hypothetical protein
MALQSVIYAEYHKLAHYTECRYAECHYAECGGSYKTIESTNAYIFGLQTVQKFDQLTVRI